MNFLITVLIKIIGLFIKKSWDTSAFCILVFEKSEMRQCRLRESLESRITGDYSLIMTGNKMKFLFLSNSAHVIYAYSLSRYVKMKNLKLLYIGQVGNRPEINHPGYLLVTPENYASTYIAEYVFASVLSFERKLLQNAFEHNNVNWKQTKYILPLPKHFNQLKIGVLGLGMVGRKVVDLFNGIGCEVFVHDRNSEKIAASDNALWPNMLSIVDYLVIAVNDTGNSNLINSELIKKMNPGLCIVNISRASVIDETAMILALKEKRIKGAILDVFHIEPIPKRNPYRYLDNVALTPHIAGNIDLVFPEIANHFSREVNKLMNV